jgi:hypothetical protein
LKKILAQIFMLWMMLSASFTPFGRSEKLFFTSTTDATCRVARAPSNIAIPRSAFLIARASFAKVDNYEECALMKQLATDLMRLQDRYKIVEK